MNFLVVQFQKHFLQFERDFASQIFQLEALVCTELAHLVFKMSQMDWLATKPQAFTCLCFPSAGLQAHATPQPFKWVLGI